MDVMVCKNCKRLFNYIYGPQFCPDCMKLIAENQVEPVNQIQPSALSPVAREEELKYQQVKDYIMANPKATVVQIAEANDIIPSKLFEWIREDRLEFSETSPQGWFVCEKCGTRIRSGRFCNNCKITVKPYKK